MSGLVVLTWKTKCRYILHKDCAISNNFAFAPMGREYYHYTTQGVALG